MARGDPSPFRCACCRRVLTMADAVFGRLWTIGLNPRSDIIDICPECRVAGCWVPDDRTANAWKPNGSRRCLKPQETITSE